MKIDNVVLEPVNSCSNCKFHSIKKVPKDVKIVKDDLGLLNEHIEKSDDEVDFFMCIKNPNRYIEIGKIPVMCDQWEVSNVFLEKQKGKKSRKTDNVDDVISKFEKRMREKQKRKETD